MTDRCVLPHRTDPDRPRRPVEGLLVCVGHREGTMRRLQAIPVLDRQLAERAAAAGGTRHGSRSAERPIPYHPAAADLRRHIRQKLSSWIRMVCEERSLTVPSIDAWRPAAAVWDVDMPGYAQTLPAVRGGRVEPEDVTPRGYTVPVAADVDGIAAWLAVHHRWLLAQDYLDDYVTDLTELHAAAWAIVHPSGRRRITVAPCTCGGRFTVSVAGGDDLLADAVCDTCAGTSPPRAWLDYGDTGVMLTAVELAALWDVPVGTVQYWAHKDNWPRDGRYPTRYDAGRAQKTYNKMRPADVDTPAGLLESYKDPACALTSGQAS